MTALGDQIIARARSCIGQFTDGPDVRVLAHDVGKAFPDLASYCAQATNTTAWCGIFVAKVLAEFGIRPPPVANGVGFMWVDTWKNWGTPVPFGEAEPGDVQIFVGSPHHVNFYPGVGGNQGDAVSEHKYRTPNYVRRAPQPGASTAPSPVNIKRNVGITATVFSSEEGNKTTAYADVGPGWDQRPGVALPYRFTGARPKVRVINNATGKSAVCDIIDQGPWNYSSSKYPGDPYWQTGARPEAESGTDQSGRHTNGAGIDLTPAAASAIGINGKGLVDWEFTENTMTDDTTHTTPPPANPSPLPSLSLKPNFIGVLQYLLQHPQDLQEFMTMLAILNGGAVPGATATPTPTPATPAALATPAVPTQSSNKLDLGAGILGVVASVVAAKNGNLAPLFDSMASTVLPTLSAGLATWGAGGGGSIIGGIINAITGKK
jgi:hypothetical protein